MSKSPEALKKHAWMSRAFDIKVSLLEALDLDTSVLDKGGQGKTVSGLQDEAAQRSRQLRLPMIAKLQQDAKLLADHIGDLPQQALAFLGAGDEAVKALALKLKDEATQRNSDQVTVKEPSSDVFHAALKRAENAQAALRDAAEDVHEAIVRERERRISALAQIDKTLQGEPLAGMTLRFDALKAYLPGGALSVVELQAAKGEIMDMRKAAKQGLSEGGAQAFDEAVLACQRAVARALKALDGGTQAETAEALRRQKRIDALKQEFESLASQIGDLPTRAEAFLGAGDPAAKDLLLKVQEEQAQRSSPQATVQEPSCAVFDSACQRTETAQLALPKAAEAVNKAILIEEERRRVALAEVDKTLQAQPLAGMGQRFSGLEAYLPDGAPVLTELKAAQGEIDDTRKAVEQGLLQGNPEAFDKTVEASQQAVARALKALDDGDQAEAAEDLRRQNRIAALNQRRTIAPIAQLAAVQQTLTTAAKDKRLTPFLKPITDADGACTLALSTCTGVLKGAAQAFDTAAGGVDLKLNLLATAVQDAETEIQAKTNFTAYTKPNEIILTWGSKNETLDPRVGQFCVFWKGTQQVISWSLLLVQLPTLQNHKVVLDTCKTEFDDLERDLPVAVLLVESAVTLQGELAQMCTKLELVALAVTQSFPAVAALRDAVAADATMDLSTLQFLLQRGDLAAARVDLDDITNRWTPLIANVAPQRLQLENACALLPIVNGAVVIRWSQALTKKDVEAALPRDCGNGARIAADIVNNPTSGKTGFTVAGKPVYHSSAGSGGQSNAGKGTAFWILQGDANSAREIIAMGKHFGSKTDSYLIEWWAAGVTVYVKVNKDTKTSMRLVELGQADKGLS